MRSKKLEPFSDLEKEAAPEHRRLHSTDYDPDNLLDALLDRMQLKTDAALAEALGVARPFISKIRHRKLPVGPTMLMRMHEASGLSIQALRQLMEPQPGQRALPSWFQPAFGHLDQDHVEIVARLWREEPALRRLTEVMETLLPARRRLTACLRCHHTGIRCLETTRDGGKRYGCSACGAEFVASEGTPFYGMRAELYPRLFAVAVVLWGPWTPFFVRKIAGCCSFKQLARYRARIQPLLDELAPAPLVSRPAYRFGFTPAQQGMRCLRCDSTDLTYAHRSNPDNPRFRCTGCCYIFHLKASRRKGLPPPPDVRCPHCDGVHLAPLRLAASNNGRAVYLCKDCQRKFTFPRKTPPVKDEMQSHPLSAASSSLAVEDVAMRVSNDRNMDCLSDSEHYDPDTLLDALRDKLKLKNDAALARVLGMAPPVISKIRHRKLAIGATILVRMHEESGLSVKDLRRLMGDRRDRFGTSSAYFMPQEGNDTAVGIVDERAP